MTDLEYTAYHEAGHAVAAFHCKRRFNYVTIVPTEDMLGHVLWWRGAQFEGKLTRQREFHDAMSPQKFKMRMEKKVFVGLAGMVATDIRFGDLEPQEVFPWQDRDHVFEWVEEISGNQFDPEGTDAMVNERQNQCRAFFKEPQNWAAVEALARALLERRRIGYLTAKKIIGEALQGNDTPRTVANV